MSDSLEFTGERFTPECVREIWYEHLHRYVFARQLVAGLNVLDAACGEGYGTAMLASAASSATGVDLSETAIEHATRRYRADNLNFLAANCLRLPFSDGQFDCIVSFETLEHLEDHDSLMAEFRRVLHPEGFLLVSTPDKAVYTDQQQNRNEFHVRELYRDEFENLLRNFFPACRLWGQKLLFHSAIWSLEGNSGVRFHQEERGLIKDFPEPHHAPVYFMALCAATETCLPGVDQGASLFDDATQSVYEHYYHEIRKNLATGAMLVEKDEEIMRLKSVLEQKSAGSSWWSRLLGKP